MDQTLNAITLFFEKAIAIPDLIESKQSEAQRLRALAYSLSAIDSSSEYVSSSRNVQCKYAELINKATDLETEILDDAQELIDYQMEVGKVIDKLSDPMCRLIMRDLYIEGLTAKEVARKRGYSERRIYDFRSKSLKECKEFHLISE